MTEASNAFFDNPAACRAALERIRLGQPSGELMMLLGSRPREIINFIEARFSEHAGVARLIEGGMGCGKTTLLNLIESSARRQGVVPIKNVIAHANYANIKAIFAMTFVRKELYQASILALKDMLESGRADAADKAIILTQGSRIGKVFEAMVRLAQASIKDGADCTGFGEKIASALYSLVVNSRVSPIREVLSSLGVDGRSISMLANEEINDLIRAHIRFFDACDIYPVWLVDEFESVCGLFASQAQNMLGFYRDLLDAIVESERGSGALFLFSTPDGVRRIASYPAFIDRLRGSPFFMLSSPTWRMSDLGKWEPGVVIPLIEKLYWGASFAGEAGAKAVVNNLDLSRDDRFVASVESTILNAALEPRVRLKRLVCEMYDVLGCSGEDLEQFFDNLNAREAQAAESPEGANADLGVIKKYPDIEPAASHDSGEFLMLGAASALEVAGSVGNVSETADVMFSRLKGHTGKDTLLESIKKAKCPHVLAERISRYRNEGGRVKEIYDFCGLQVVGEDDYRLDSVWEVVDRALSQGGALRVLIEQKVEGDDEDEDDAYSGESAKNILKAIKELRRRLAGRAVDEDEENKSPAIHKGKASQPKRLEKVETCLDVGSSPSMLRHVIYTLLCQRGILIEDQVIDRIVLALMAKYRGYVPLPSRYGVFFQIAGRGASGSEDDYTCISDHSVIVSEPNRLFV